MGGELESAQQVLSGMGQSKAEVESRSKGRYDRLSFTGRGVGSPFSFPQGAFSRKKGHPLVTEGRLPALALSCLVDRRIKSACC